MRADRKAKLIRPRRWAQTRARPAQHGPDDEEVRMLSGLLETIEGLLPYGVVTADADARLTRHFEDDRKLLAKVRERMGERDRAIEVDLDDL
ncbi:MAG: hypothetical protein H0W40_11540 [Methylibium sp.]|uniref:hypothetical protein n=1 Tax=Methylibium sp. TaxID=2067992 RepID=UPI001790EDC2|nr:hypothetical protein [Methylibium sp.]MBA3597990.1 hypothetical protein [Methylibium sp.]